MQLPSCPSEFHQIKGRDICFHRHSADLQGRKQGECDLLGSCSDFFSRVLRAIYAASDASSNSTSSSKYKGARQGVTFSPRRFRRIRYADVSYASMNLRLKKL